MKVISKPKNILIKVIGKKNNIFYKHNKILLILQIEKIDRKKIRGNSR